jgi:hypothetical protein
VSCHLVSMAFGRRMPSIQDIVPDGFSVKSAQSPVRLGLFASIFSPSHFPLVPLLSEDDTSDRFENGMEEATRSVP